MRTTTVAFQLVAVLAVAAALVFPGAHAGSVNFTYTFGGGLAFCSQCGTPGQYACSPDNYGTTIGNWNNGVVSFQDPTPVGAVPHAVRVSISGTWSCDPSYASAMFGILLNGVVYAVRDTPNGQTSNPCKCDTCDTADGVQFTFRNGVPGYVKGGVNRLQIVLYRNNICANKATIYIDYETTGLELPHIFTPVLDFKSLTNYTSCPVCNSGQVGESIWCSNTGLSHSFTVQDPLPRGALLVGVDVHFSYNVLSRSYNAVYTTLAFALTGISINTERAVDNTFRQQCGCMTNTVLQSPFYQRGWPGYVYGSRNTFTITGTRYVSGYGDVCIGRMGVDFIYYFPDQTEPVVLRHHFGLDV